MSTEPNPGYAAGNLLGYGLSPLYEYDALGRMTRNDGDTLRSNGDGVLVQAGGTRYVQDLAAPLAPRARPPMRTIDIHGHTTPRPLPACAAPNASLAAIAAQMQAHAIAPPVLLATSFSRQGSGIATSRLFHGRRDRGRTPPHAEHATPPARQMGGSLPRTPHRHRPHTTENAVAAACRPVDRVRLR